MTAYKLTDQDCYTRRGMSGETFWKLGVRHEITDTGTRLCTNQVFHFYPSAAMAAFANPIGAQIVNPRCFEVEVEDVVNRDSIKGGCKAITRGQEVPVPVLTLEQRIEIGIRCALTVYKDPGFQSWANAWLSGEDRTAKAAAAPSYAAYAANAAADAAKAALVAAYAANTAHAADAPAYAAYAADAAANAAGANGNTLDVDGIIKSVLAGSEGERK